jgi:hypothetical protein
VKRAAEKEREQRGRRRNGGVLGWGGSKVGALGRYFGKYPAAGRGRGLRAGGDAEEEEEELSALLQGMPPGVGTGTVTRMAMGR